MNVLFLFRCDFLYYVHLLVMWRGDFGAMQVEDKRMNTLSGEVSNKYLF